MSHERLRPMGQVRRMLRTKASPVTPEDALKSSMKARRKDTPRPLRKTINTLLKQKTDSSGFCNIHIEEVEAIMGARRLGAVNEAAENNWNNIAAIYRNKGWSVDYKPQANPPYLKFMPRKQVQ